VPDSSRDPRAECRAILERNGLDPGDLDAQVAAIARNGVLRDQIYEVVADALHVQRLHAALDPEWCSRRDEALNNLRTARDELAAVLRDAPIVGDISEARLAELDVAIANLFNKNGQGLSYLQLSRSIIFGAPVRRGRPVNVWRRQATARLRELQLSREQITDIVSASGLAMSIRSAALGR
jgi:hypothetical protein